MSENFERVEEVVSAPSNTKKVTKKLALSVGALVGIASVGVACFQLGNSMAEANRPVVAVASPSVSTSAIPTATPSVTAKETVEPTSTPSADVQSIMPEAPPSIDDVPAIVDLNSALQAWSDSRMDLNKKGEMILKQLKCENVVKSAERNKPQSSYYTIDKNDSNGRLMSVTCYYFADAKDFEGAKGSADTWDHEFNVDIYKDAAAADSFCTKAPVDCNKYLGRVVLDKSMMTPQGQDNTFTEATDRLLSLF